MKKIILGFSFFVFSLFLTAAAQGQGLVPCVGIECQWRHLYILIDKIIDFGMYLVLPIAVVMIVVGGIMIMTSAGSEKRYSKGKEIITAGVVGLVIALLAWLIIDTIIKVLSGGDFGPWNRLKYN